MPKNEFTSAKRRADAAMIDDRFKMGGNMYRITDLKVTTKTVHFTFYPVDGEPLDTVASLTIPRETVLKLYNQK